MFCDPIDLKQKNQTQFGWRLKPFWSIARQISITEVDNLQLLSVYLDRGVIKFSDIKTKRTNVTSDDKSKYQKVNPGNLVMNNQQSWRGSVGISQYKGIVSPAYFVFEISNELNPIFANYLFRDKTMVEQYLISSRGVGSIQRNLHYPSLKNIKIGIPSIFEQNLITKYLDKKTQKIENLIKRSEIKIELLKEQKESLINKSVTKGLDENVLMKNSGIEWIGEIPQHWNISKVKFHGEVIVGLSFDKEDINESDTGTLVLRSSNVQEGKVSFKDNIWVKKSIPEKLRIKTGDILICSRNGSRRLIGKNCLLGIESEGMTWGVFMTVLRTTSSRYFYWILNSQLFKSQSGMYLTSTINQLTVSTLENLVITYTSNLEEQNEIDQFLTKKTEKIDQLIEKERERISLLKEYRDSLISSVVTGKIRITEDMI